MSNHSAFRLFINRQNKKLSIPIIAIACFGQYLTVRRAKNKKDYLCKYIIPMNESDRNQSLLKSSLYKGSVSNFALALISFHCSNYTSYYI